MRIGRTDFRLCGGQPGRQTVLCCSKIGGDEILADEAENHIRLCQPFLVYFIFPGLAGQDAAVVPQLHLIGADKGLRAVLGLPYKSPSLWL